MVAAEKVAGIKAVNIHIPKIILFWMVAAEKVAGIKATKNTKIILFGHTNM